MLRIFMPTAQTQIHETARRSVELREYVEGKLKRARTRKWDICCEVAVLYFASRRRAD